MDSQTRSVLEMMKARMPGGMPLDVSSLRAGELSGLPPLAIERSQVERVEDRDFAGPAGRIAVRIYTPKLEHRAAATPPVLVYFHGGGHVVGTLDGWDGLCCRLCSGSGMIVVSVEYRLAPESKFPAAPEDCYAAVSWVAAHAKEFGANGSRIAVAGDSAGGNLAAVVSLIARDRGGPRIDYQVLFYPVTAGRAETPSSVRNGSGYLLTREAMSWFSAQYVRTDADRDDAYYAPLKAKDLSGLPPAYIVTAEFDPLLDEGEAYARRLREAGVEVTYESVAGTIHGFISFYLLIDLGKQAIAKTTAILREKFALLGSK